MFTYSATGSMFAKQLTFKEGSGRNVMFELQKSYVLCLSFKDNIIPLQEWR